MATVAITDHAWPDLTVEHDVLAAAGHVLVGPATDPSEAAVDRLVAEHVPAAIMTCWAPVSARAVATPPGLRIVARMGVGLDNIAVPVATERGIWVTNVPDYCVEEVSDHAVALALGWLRGVVPLDREVQAGRWEPAGARLARVATLTAGIIGYGRIGHRTAEKLTGLGMRVLAYARAAARTVAGPARLVDLDALLARSDVVVLHLPLTSETHHLVDAAFLARMRPHALLVNVSRGPVVDTAALVAALDAGQIGAAALDVVEGEPTPPAALLGRPNVIVTPHVAFSSLVSIVELRRRACEEVVRILQGEAPHHPCNTPAGGAAPR